MKRIAASVLTVVCSITVAFDRECVASGDLQTCSLQELVSELEVEHQTAAESLNKAVSFHTYDVIVAEILRRRNKAVVPLLLERINDESLVRLAAHADDAWRAWYDTPVRVKYKVRFILRQMLVSRDFATLVPNPLLPLVDTQAARAYYEANQRQIQLRPQVESPAPISESR